MRLSGKTYRAVLRALADASEGKFVVFVSGYSHDDRALRFAHDLTHCLHDCAYFNAQRREVTFRKDDGVEVIGTLNVTHIEAFEQDVRGGRYRGTERTKFKMVFDDCGPSERLRDFLKECACG